MAGVDGVEAEAGGSEEWYKDARYHVFWQHYATMLRTAHRDAVLRARHVAAHTQAALLGMLGRPRINKPDDRTLVKQRSRSRQRKRKRRRKSNRKQGRTTRSKVYSDTDSLDCQMSQAMQLGPGSDHEDDMEVPEDMLEFLEQSRRHREERQVLREQKIKAEASCRTGAQEIMAQKEHPDVIRSREMQELYGAASPRIHAMETALQLSFDRISTQHAPKLWPNIPFNIEFD